MCDMSARAELRFSTVRDFKLRACISRGLFDELRAVRVIRGFDGSAADDCRADRLDQPSLRLDFHPSGTDVAWCGGRFDHEFVSVLPDVPDALRFAAAATVRPLKGPHRLVGQPNLPMYRRCKY